MGKKSRNTYASRTPAARTPSTEDTTVSTPEVIEDTLTPKQPVPDTEGAQAETPVQEDTAPQNDDPVQGSDAGQDDAASDNNGEEIVSEETPDEEPSGTEAESEEQAEDKADLGVYISGTVEENPVAVDTVDDPLVAELNVKLTEFKTALEGFGKTPEDFKDAAKKAAGVTKFVLKNAKPQVLDALLAFFVANKDGVATPAEVMKGSTTLPRGEEQQVGFLFNLFMALANRRVQNVNNSAIINVLRKPEIASYYLRKANGIRASKA